MSWFSSLLITILFVFSTHTVAGSVEVIWVNPEKFTDLRPAEESKTRYRDRILKGFEKLFNKMAVRLPEGYVWKLKVTDIDLAGEVNGAYRINNRDIRIVKSLYFPTIKFSYQLFDAKKQMVLSDNVNLKDMGFNQRYVNQNTHSELAYERAMLHRWFKQSILSHIPS